jgi:hypothetical protein
MRGSERVVHVHVGEGGERLCEAAVVLFFLRVEAEILQHDDLAALGGTFDSSFRDLPD